MKQNDEKAIEDLNATIDEWECDPWDLRNPALKSMQFPVTTELIDDLNKAYEEGIEIMKTYYKERITTSTKLITDTIKRNKRYSFRKLPSSTADCSSLATQKTLQLKTSLYFPFVSLAQETKLNLDYLMNFR